METKSDPQDLLALIIEAITLKDSKSLNTYIIEQGLQDQTICWELILKLGENVNPDNNESAPEFFDVVNCCLVYLVKVGNPKETLLAVLEQMDTFIDDIKFKCFLPLVQTSLLKIPNKLFHSLDIALETISAHIQALPMPENANLEGDEIKAFDLDTTVIRLTESLSQFLDFLEPFVKRLDLKREKLSDPAMHEAAVLKKHLIQVFDQPLCHLLLCFDEEDSDTFKSESRVCAERAMLFLAILETNLYRLLRNISHVSDVEDNLHKEGLKDLLSKDDAEDEDMGNEENEKKEGANNRSKVDMVENWDFKLKVSDLAQACIAYLIHSESLGLEKFPTIYSHNHILEIHLKSLSILLSNTVFAINMKGLFLAKKLISLLDKNSISNDSFDNPGYLNVINSLIVIMTKCPVKDNRILATKIFPQFINKFESGARYKIYISILSSCTHSGVKGFVITIIKDDIANKLTSLKQDPACKETSDSPTDKSKNDVFTGKQLHRLLLTVVKLPEHETTDMLENSDQIISGLNFLRYLVLANPVSHDHLRLWAAMPQVEKQFLAPLRRGLELSKAHYELEQSNMISGRAGLLSQGGPEMTMSVGGSSLPTMERKEKVELLGRAINTHDIMMGLTARVSELVDQSKNNV